MWLAYLDATEQGEPASPCSTEPLASSALWDACLVFFKFSTLGERKSKLSVRGDSKILCAWGSAAGKPRSQSLLTGYTSGLRFWLQTSQFDQKYTRVTSQLRHGIAVGAVISPSWLIGSVVGPSKSNCSFRKLRGLKLKAVGRMQKSVTCCGSALSCDVGS